MLIVRPAKYEEIEQIAQIGIASWRKGILPLVKNDVAACIEENNPFIPFLEAQGENVLVAEIDGMLAGLGAAEHGDNHISDIWVAPEHEGKGVTSALIAELEKQFKAKGYNEATIRVAAGNSRALNLYLHLGYRETWRDFDHDPVLNATLEKVALAKSIGR